MCSTIYDWMIRERTARGASMETRSSIEALNAYDELLNRVEKMRTSDANLAQPDRHLVDLLEKSLLLRKRTIARQIVTVKHTVALLSPRSRAQCAPRNTVAESTETGQARFSGLERRASGSPRPALRGPGSWRSKRQFSVCWDTFLQERQIPARGQHHDADLGGECSSEAGIESDHFAFEPPAASNSERTEAERQQPRATLVRMPSSM